MIFNNELKVYLSNYNPKKDSIKSIYNIISQYEQIYTINEVQKRFESSSTLLVKSLIDDTLLGFAICDCTGTNCVVYINKSIQRKERKNIENLLDNAFREKYAEPNHLKFLTV